MRRWGGRGGEVSVSVVSVRGEGSLTRRTQTRATLSGPRFVGWRERGEVIACFSGFRIVPGLRFA